MGALIQPRGWNDWPDASRKMLQASRSSAAEAMALAGDLFEQALTSGILGRLSEEELAESLLNFVRTWPAQREVTVRGLHFMQEDSPHEIGQAIAKWLTSLLRQPPLQL